MGNEKSRAYKEMVGVSKDENVWFSFIVFECKEHRDQVNAKGMEEIEQQSMPDDFMMPYDIKRMSNGGFQVVVEG